MGRSFTPYEANGNIVIRADGSGQRKRGRMLNCTLGTGCCPSSSTFKRGSGIPSHVG